MPKVGRNEACPCGSGKKYKRCCEAKEARDGSRLLLIAVGSAILGALILGIAQFNREESAAPPGRVWSAEHGHYH
jgi:hypothetical protein